MLARLKPLLEDPAVLKIAQDLKFNHLFLARHGIALAPYDDTMLLAYALEGGTGIYDLDGLSNRLLGYTPITFKDVAGSGRAALTFDQVALERATEYAAEDADLALRLWLFLKPRLVAERMTNVYETLERPLVPVLTRMERRGIKVDRQILSRLSGELSQKLAGLEAEIYRLAGGEFNIGSPKQLGDIFFGQLGLPGGTKTKTGAWSTGADVLEELAASGNDLAARVLDWRQLSKLKSTYTDLLPGFIHPETGRVHTSYALASTTTGRLSSSDPNLQNIPIRTEEGRRIRTAFVAEAGHKLISADYSQIELRVLAHIAEIPQLRQAFADGLDIHAMTASEMFGVPVEGMPRGGQEPRQGDQFRHRLRHLGLRPGEPARHPARRGRRLYQEIFRALPGHPRLHGGDAPEGPPRRPCDDPVRPQGAFPAGQVREPGRARLRRPRLDQRADPGHGGRHHPPGDDPHGAGARRGRPVGADAPPGP